MKKTNRSKLSLTREHIRVLTPAALADVAGGRIDRTTMSDFCCRRSDSCETGTLTGNSAAVADTCG